MLGGDGVKNFPKKYNIDYFNIGIQILIEFWSGEGVKNRKKKEQENSKVSFERNSKNQKFKRSRNSKDQEIQKIKKIQKKID